MKIYSHEYAWSDMGDQYRQAHEVPAYPEGFRERLEGLTLEEQLRRFAFVENMSVSRSSYGDTDKIRQTGRVKPVTELYEYRGVIVENGIVEGVMLKTIWGYVPANPYVTVTTYYASDDEGSGSNDREDTATLICLPEDQIWP